MIITNAQTANMKAAYAWNTAGETLTIEQNGNTVILNDEDLADLRLLLMRSTMGIVNHGGDR